MRNYDADDEYDVEEAARLKAEPWILELLAMNPSYPHWGPYEGYMWKRGRDEGPDELGRTGDHGWESRCLVPDWKSRVPMECDDLNEVVNFYFAIHRESVPCEMCNGDGYHPDAQWISESFYEHSSPFRTQSVRAREASMLLASFGDTLPRESAIGQADGNFPSNAVLKKYPAAFREFCEAMRDGDGCWHDKITQDEVAALIEGDRLTFLVRDKGAGITAEDVNQVNRSGRGMGQHDAINRGILIRKRCERLGVPTQCTRCEGHGTVFVEPEPHVSLTLWLLHPRKGASRGVEIKRIQQSELPEVFAFLRTAADRNAARFARIPTP